MKMKKKNPVLIYGIFLTLVAFRFVSSETFAQTSKGVMKGVWVFSRALAIGADVKE